MRYFGLALLFTSLSTIACPDLTGTYASCTSATGASAPLTNVIITQLDARYTMTGIDVDGQQITSVIYADGRDMVSTETDEHSGMVFTTTTRAACSSMALSIVSKIDLDGMPVGNLITEVTSDGTQLIQEIHGTIFGQPLEDTVTCQ